MLLSGLPEEQEDKSRFCEDHRQAADNIKDQAVADGKSEYADQILYCPAKCAEAINRWLKDNPHGRFRKRLIDWGQWERHFCLSTKVTQRQGEIAWAWSDWSEEKGDAGWSATRILKKWNAYFDDLNIQREGEGDKLELWIPERKRRMRDVVKEVTNCFKEGPIISRN